MKANPATRISNFFVNYFSLNGQLVSQAEAEAAIRESVSFKGTSILILILAIFIASLGLNTNSTAVIIGAMLISPLMGPIIGLGLGIGVHDFELIKRCLRNLLMAAGFSVITATLYFLISPVNEEHSELLARTSPTIYDVLIGFFGGGAGIIALGSTNKGNAITGRGTVATGRIETGVVKVGDEVQIMGLGADMKSVVTGVEMFRKLLDQGEAGDNVGLLLRGIDKKDIKRGMVICHPGVVKPHNRFKASVYILKKEEGGRHTPFHNHYRPQFYIRTLDVTGEITLPEGVEMVMPGDHVEIIVDLINPVACDQGLRFAIREGGRTVGSGQITEILD